MIQKYLRYLRGTLDRTQNSVWGRKASIAYAFGTWTLLGLMFAKWKTMTSDHVLQQESEVRKLSDEEKAELKYRRLAEQKRRSEEISLYVAENVYTPLDFMA